MSGHVSVETSFEAADGEDVRALVDPGTVATLRTRWLLEQISELEARNRELEARNRALRSNVARLARQALIDPLTGLANRRHLDGALDRQLAAAARTGRSLALLLCDIDAFKHYNDTYGHGHGDTVLVRIGALLQNFCRRDGDCAARYGGEEFALLLPDRRSREAVLLAERLRNGVAALSIGRLAVSVTVSVGVASVESGTPARRRQLIEAADAALYRAKRGGRNRTEYQKVGPVEPAGRRADEY